MPMIQLYCPHCRKVRPCPQDTDAILLRCPDCGQRMQIQPFGAGGGGLSREEEPAPGTFPWAPAAPDPNPTAYSEDPFGPGRPPPARSATGVVRRASAGDADTPTAEYPIKPGKLEGVRAAGVLLCLAGG